MQRQQSRQKTKTKKKTKHIWVASGKFELFSELGWSKSLLEQIKKLCCRPAADSHWTSLQLFTWVLDDDQQEVILCKIRNRYQLLRTNSHKENRFSVTNSSIPGATKISCFLERRRRKVRSFWGSISRTVLLAFMVRLRRSPAYCTAVELSKVVLMGIPGNVNQRYQLDTNTIVMLHLRHHLPSALTTIVPITPLCPSILFSVSSTSAFGTRKKITLIILNNNVIQHLKTYES